MDQDCYLCQKTHIMGPGPGVFSRVPGISAIAQKRGELDIYDGEKVNYLNLGNVLAPILGLSAQDKE